jgi:hypothetical protein
MKNFSILLSFLFIASCSLSVDETKAKQLVESLFTDLKKENFARLDEYYISSFNESEPLEKKTEKHKKLEEATGKIVSWELLSSEEKYDDYTNLKVRELVYKVNGTKLSVKHTVRIINDAGDLKIVFQNIGNL